MAYYLKKTKHNGRTYLSIDESFYDHKRKGAAHRCYKSLASVESWQAKGIKDPVAHFQKEVDELNKKAAATKVPKISEKSPVLHLGYFPLKVILEKMRIKKFLDTYKTTNDFTYDLYEIVSSLIYARAVNPCSKHRTFHEVLPNLYEKVNFSYDQLMDGLGFIGDVYQKIIELFTQQTKSKFGIDTSKTYFDCTNFYFEIDREDDFRRKGPSKEGRSEPIVGLGLLLDKNQIPIGMEIYPGNRGESPALRNIIDRLKMSNNIVGRTIHVADKGLNCAKNIAFSKLNGDGYLFSKSVKMLPEIEKKWVLLNDGWKERRDEKGNLLYKYKSCIAKLPYKVEFEGKEKTIELTEKRIATYNPTLASKKRYEINRLVEKAMKLTLSATKKSEFGESGKYVSFTGNDGEKANVTINLKAIENDLKMAGYNLLVTSETKMSDQDIYDTYHNLWRIEESFRIMKSDLDARPVFCQQENTIKGHFLICYLTVLLERILQFKILKNKFSSSEIFRFMKKFNMTKAERKYVNTANLTKFVAELEEVFNCQLISNYFLSETQIKSILNIKI